MRDFEIRTAVKNLLLDRFLSQPDTLVVEELGLRHGAARIDLAVINGSLHGYELKSDQDTLRRLPGQVAVYNCVLDRVTLVVTDRHISKATRMIPEWWEVILAESQMKGVVTLRTVRCGAENPSVSPSAVAKLLWREEALQLLMSLGALDGMRSKSRRMIYRRITELIDLPQLQFAVSNQLRSRKDWRSVGQQILCDG